MSNASDHQPPECQGLSEAQIAYLVDVARRAGVELDPSGSVARLNAVRGARETAHEFEFLTDHGIGGHELAVIDFDPSTLERLRRIGRLIAMAPRLSVQSALAISGSSAQGRIQPYPSDLDFFECVHIVCPRMDDAKSILANLVRDNALTVAALPGVMLDEVYFGALDGKPLRWSPLHLLDGVHGAGESQLGSTRQWSDVAKSPGFIKIDWLLLDRALGGPAKLSKVVDATWSGPDGVVVSLDDAIDADFQQIYLDADGAGLAAFLTRELPRETRDDYVTRLEQAIVQYCAATPPDYAKVAKRLYNVCRLTGRYSEAIYLRELFDERPARAAQAMTRLRLAVRHPSERGVDHAEIASAYDELAQLLKDHPRWQSLRASMEAADFDVDASTLTAIIRDLEYHVQRFVSAAFQRRLHDFPPTTSLLQEITERQAARAAPRGRGSQPGD